MFNEHNPLSEGTFSTNGVELQVLSRTLYSLTFSLVGSDLVALLALLILPRDPSRSITRAQRGSPDAVGGPTNPRRQACCMQPAEPTTWMIAISTAVATALGETAPHIATPRQE